MIFDSLNRSTKAIENWFMDPVDARVYACVRIAYGLLCLCVIIEVWPVSDSLFSEVGMSWHRPDLLWYIPFKYIRTPGAVHWMMAVAAIASLMMTVGLFTRFAAVLLYLWNFSYCAIGYPAEAGYDGIARIVGFVMLWAPQQRIWALDARIFGPGNAEEPRYTLRLMQAQLVIIYICTVWLKAPDNYWRTGELMSYFLMSMYARIPTWHWADWGRTSVLLSWGTLIAETTIPVALVLSQWMSREVRPRFRRLGFAMGLWLHGGIALTSTIHMFSIAMVPLYLAFLTSDDIDDVAALIARFRRKKELPAAASAEAAATPAKTATSTPPKTAASTPAKT